MESPFAGMLKTNYVPLDSEVEQICQFITGKMKELSRLEEPITHFPDIVNNFTRHRDTLNEHIQDHRALISGARRIPRDVLEEVFVRCLPTGQNARMRADESPVLLGHICSAWRQISLTSPHLWSSLHVDAYPVPDTKLQLRVEAAESWLNRSRNSLLSVSFSITGHEHKPHIPAYDLPQIQQLMGVFNAYSRRWKSLKLSMTMLLFSMWSPTLTTADVPMLEMVELRLIDRHDTPAGISQRVLPVILKAQSLRIISLIDMMSIPCIIAPCWGQLTTLSLLRSPSGTIFSLTWQQALLILRHTSNLRRFSLQLGYSLARLPLHQEDINITLMHLESFRIDVKGDLDLADFFNVLVMPSLKHLAISCEAAELSNIPFISFLTQPHVIETMELKLNEFPPDHLIELLALVPSLRGLCLVEMIPVGDGSILNEDIIKRLIPGVDGQCLCPCLEEVRICSAVVGVENDALLTFLRTRTQSAHLGVTRLRHAALSFAVWGQQTDITTDMAPFNAKELNVNLSHWNRFDETVWQKGWAYG
jgi:hypothetical protein